MAEEITLFDLPSKPPNKAWSFNPWKTRLILNYKKLPYRTHWLEFPDIAPHLKSLGIPPNAQGKPYTVPTIHFPSTDAHPVDEYIMDSKAIAIALEKAYPDPPLHLDAPQLAKAEELRGQAIGALMGPFAGKGLALLNERSKEYMATANLAGFAHGEEAWDGATPVLEAIGALLKEKGGPFVLGETASQQVLEQRGHLFPGKTHCSTPWARQVGQRTPGTYSFPVACQCSLQAATEDDNNCSLGRRLTPFVTGRSTSSPPSPFRM
ncbi:MAG: hypothetical protein LQ346_006567 [Caloplaca aetnensis]|nr:MAG: hypothetical protein LQ346_006567 [Caloplaca aetnensis]